LPAAKAEAAAASVRAAARGKALRRIDLSSEGHRVGRKSRGVYGAAPLGVSGLL
jgi:hypothetical protein